MPSSRTGPAGSFPGTTIKGGLNVRTPNPFNDSVRVIDEWGNIRTPDILATEFYPKSLPAAPGGKPTYAQCQLLVAKIAATLAQRTVRSSAILRYIYRGLFQGNLQTASVTLGGASLSGLTTPTYSESVPVDVLLNNSTLIDNLASRLASQIAVSIDTVLLSLYVEFSTNSAVGTAGTALTTTVLNSAVADLQAANEPIFIAIHPLELGWSAAADFGAGLPVSPIPYGVGTNGATVTGSNTWADVMAAAGETANTQPAAWLIPTPLVSQTGSGPATTHNLAFTPSALGVGAIQVPEVNDGINAQKTSIFENFALTVFINNTGSGNQAVYAGVAYVPGMITNANGVQVKS